MLEIVITMLVAHMVIQIPQVTSYCHNISVFQRFCTVCTFSVVLVVGSFCKQLQRCFRYWHEIGGIAGKFPFRDVLPRIED